MKLVKRAHFNLINWDDLFYIIYDLKNTYFSWAMQQNLFSAKESWVATNNGATCDDWSWYIQIYWSSSQTELPLPFTTVERTVQSKKLAQFRSSSHHFNIKTLRHGTHKRNQVVIRICNACSTDERILLDNFAEMPFFDPIIEYEVHVLRPCSLYEDYRHRWSQRAKTCFFVNLEELFTDDIKETTKFLVRANILNSRRFPKKEVAKTHPLKTSCDVPVTPQ